MSFVHGRGIKKFHRNVFPKYHLCKMAKNGELRVVTTYTFASSGSVNTIFHYLTKGGSSDFHVFNGIPIRHFRRFRATTTLLNNVVGLRQGGVSRLPWRATKGGGNGCSGACRTTTSNNRRKHLYHFRKRRGATNSMRTKGR